MSDYTTTATVKAAMNKTTAGDDATIAKVITFVSRLIDRECNRADDGFLAGAVATARTFVGNGGAYQRIDECAATPTLVEVKSSASSSSYTAWAATDWIAASGDVRWPDFNHAPYDLLLIDPNGDYSVFSNGRYTSLQGFRPSGPLSARGLPTVRVTAQWGYATTIPSVIEQACIIETARLYKRGQSAFADGVANQDFGNLVFAKGLDPATREMLFNARMIRPALGGRRP